MLHLPSVYAAPTMSVEEVELYVQVSPWFEAWDWLLNDMLLDETSNIYNGLGAAGVGQIRAELRNLARHAAEIVEGDETLSVTMRRSVASIAGQLGISLADANIVCLLGQLAHLAMVWSQLQTELVSSEVVDGWSQVVFDEMLERHEELHRQGFSIFYREKYTPGGWTMSGAWHQ
jgi:hypothetical protein